MSPETRKAMIDRDNKAISIVRQCKLVNISRSSVYYQKKGLSELNLKLMKEIDEIHLERPVKGSRAMVDRLLDKGYVVNRKRIQRLMRLMGIEAIYPKPKTSLKNKKHKVFPYLLKNLRIEKSNQVWVTDITYIPMQKGFAYLTAIMDLYSRKILSWRLSNTMDTIFCKQALTEALQKYPKPQYFNSDQGSQYTSGEFTDILKENNIKISMDSKGRWIDNVFIERFWRTLKYEEVYLRAYDSIREAQDYITIFMKDYNHNRRHSSLNRQSPDKVYYEGMPSFEQEKLKALKQLAALKPNLKAKSIPKF